MNCQPFSRNQRSKGLKMKQCFQLALLLAVGVWLLYQIKHSLNEGKGYGKTVNIKDPGAAIFGRKGSASSSGSEKGNFGAGDDELAGKANELSRDESFPDEDVHNHNSLASVQEEIPKETDIPNMTSLNSTDNASEDLPREDYTGKGHDYLRVSMLDNDDQGDGDATDLKSQTDQIKMPPDEMENSTDLEQQQALLDGVHGFHDENGIPELGSDHLISALIGENILPRETQTVLSSNNGTPSAEEVKKTDDGDVSLSEATKEDH